MKHYTIFIKRLLLAMKGHVSLSDVLTKITKEHRKQPLKEFRRTITSMLDNVKYESSVLGTVKNILGSSNYKDIQQLHRLKCAAYTNVDFWDSNNNNNNNGGSSGGGGGAGGTFVNDGGTGMSAADMEEQKKAIRKKMKRYRKRLNIRKKPLYEIGERWNGSGGGGSSASSRTLLSLQPVL